MQKDGIGRDVPANEYDGSGQCTGVCVLGRPGPTIGLELRVDELPRRKLGDMIGCHQRKTDPVHWRIPPALHIGAYTRLGGGTDTLLGPRSHIFRGPKCQHRKLPEPAQLEGC